MKLKSESYGGTGNLPVQWCGQAGRRTEQAGCLSHDSERASALIVVLWVCFGLVSVSLYFAHSMSFEMRAADNRVAALQAEQAIAGAARYVSNVLALAEVPGMLPELQTYESTNVAVGEAAFWLIGRTNEAVELQEPCFGFVDEASKLNLNTATVAMLELLPRMTPELAAAIVDWRDEDSTVSDGGAEDETYARLDPPYRCKNTPFESIDELRLVYDMDMELLYGNDANLNGALELNENDGDNSPPLDDRTGTLDPGLLEYVTVWSRESVTGRTNVNEQQALAAVLQAALGTSRANQVLASLGGAGGGGGGGAAQPQQFANMVEFYLASQMTRSELDQVTDQLVATTNTTGTIEGLVNINTASEAVLECIPGIGTQYASSILSYRLGNDTRRASIAWLVEVIGSEAARQAGPYVTTHSYQVIADIAAVGRYGRGYQRVKHVFDTSDGMPRVVYRQDLTHLGWAPGRAVREELQVANNIR